jgi:hypothetical protein
LAQAEANALTPDLKALPSEQVVMLVLIEPPGTTAGRSRDVMVFGSLVVHGADAAVGSGPA